MRSILGCHTIPTYTLWGQFLAEERPPPPPIFFNFPSRTFLTPQYRGERCVHAYFSGGEVNFQKMESHIRKSIFIHIFSEQGHTELWKKSTLKYGKKILIQNERVEVNATEMYPPFFLHRKKLINFKFYLLFIFPYSLLILHNNKYEDYWAVKNWIEKDLIISLNKREIKLTFIFHTVCVIWFI